MRYTELSVAAQLAAVAERLRQLELEHLVHEMGAVEAGAVAAQADGAAFNLVAAMGDAQRGHRLAQEELGARMGAVRGLAETLAAETEES